MGDGETCPVLISRKKLKSEFSDLQKIQISCDTFSLGRGLNNALVIPFIAISRNHCSFKKDAYNNWIVEDNSSFGIKINGDILGKGSSKTLNNGDILTLEQTEEFVYEFRNHVDTYEVPRKRIKLEEDTANDNNMISNMKIKFEESQSHEREHIEHKLTKMKQMQTTSMIRKTELQKEMNSRIEQLEKDFTLQIENLKGEKNEIERQKAMLLEEKDAQLATIKSENEEKIMELMEQVRKQNEAETELLKENNTLKEKLEKEREEFLAELSRESSSKKDMLEKLEAKIKEQEEIRAKEREEALELLHREVEKLKTMKDQVQEREEIKERLLKAQSSAASSFQELMLEDCLHIVETERNKVLEQLSAREVGEGSTKETVLNKVGDLLESELQCSICSELFVAATILNCVTTFFWLS